MNFSTFAPVNYGIDPMELTPLSKRMSDVLTLADMMDKRKTNALVQQKAEMEIADANRKLRGQEALMGQAQKTLETFNTPQPTLTAPVEPVLNAPLPDIFSTIQSSAASPENLSQGLKDEYGYDIPVSAIAAARATPLQPGQAGPVVDRAVIGRMIMDQPLGGSTGETFEAEKAAKEAEYSDALTKYKADKAAQAPENRIPENLRGLVSPAQYEQYLKAMAIHPDVGTEYLTKIADLSKTASEIEKNKRISETDPYGKSNVGLNLRLAQDPVYVSGIQSRISNLESAGKIPPHVAVQLRGLALTMPLDADRQATEYITGIAQAVGKEEELLPGRTRTAAATAGAGETARTAAGAVAGTKVASTSLPGFRPLPGYNITEEDTKEIKTSEPRINALVKGIQELRDRYKKQGVKLTGDDARWYKSKITSLQLLAKGKELYDLGVLAGPDMEILLKALPDPSSIKEGIGKLYLGDLDIGYQTFEDLVKGKRDSFYKIHGFEKVPAKTLKVGDYTVEVGE